MKEKDFLEKLRGLSHIPWSRPPRHAVDKAKEARRESPVAPPSEQAEVRGLKPADVRAAGTAGSALITESLAGVDVTLSLTPPTGDGLWTVQGRVWPKQSGTGPVRVVLVQDDHVLSTLEIPGGGTFLFQEPLSEGWALEFHLTSGETAVLRSPTG